MRSRPPGSATKAGTASGTDEPLVEVGDGLRPAITHLSSDAQTGKKEKTLEKKQPKTKQKLPLTLRTETLRRLEGSQLQGVAGGARIRIPVGFADDTTPIYDDTTG